MVMEGFIPNGQPNGHSHPGIFPNGQPNGHGHPENFPNGQWSQPLGIDPMERLAQGRPVQDRGPEGGQDHNHK